jgi:DNA-binding Lrp family transcriptional regulator
MKLETQTELGASEKYQKILKLIENNPRINLRNLVLLTNYRPQDVWYALVELKERKIIESVIISNGKSGWNVQYGLRDEFRK